MPLGEFPRRPTGDARPGFSPADVPERLEGSVEITPLNSDQPDSELLWKQYIAEDQTLETAAIPTTDGFPAPRRRQNTWSPMDRSPIETGNLPTEEWQPQPWVVSAAQKDSPQLPHHHHSAPPERPAGTTGLSLPYSSTGPPAHIPKLERDQYQPAAELAAANAAAPAYPPSSGGSLQGSSIPDWSRKIGKLWESFSSNLNLGQMSDNPILNQAPGEALASGFIGLENVLFDITALTPWESVGLTHLIDAMAIQIAPDLSSTLHGQISNLHRMHLSIGNIQAMKHIAAYYLDALELQSHLDLINDPCKPCYRTCHQQYSYLAEALAKDFDWLADSIEFTVEHCKHSKPRHMELSLLDLYITKKLLSSKTFFDSYLPRIQQLIDICCCSCVERRSYRLGTLGKIRQQLPRHILPDLTKVPKEYHPRLLASGPPMTTNLSLSNESTRLWRLRDRDWIKNQATAERRSWGTAKDHWSELMTLEAPLLEIKMEESRSIRKDLATTTQDDKRVTFTDSGYASGPIMGTCIEGVPNEPGNEVAESASLKDSETQTCYTGPSTDDRLTTQQYVQEFAENIYTQLRLKESNQNWQRLLTNSSRLLRAFAVKLGLYSNTLMHRKAMRFIHRHSQDVTDRIRLLCEQEMEITDLGRDSSGSMSLCEKMELWSKADSEHSGARPEPDAPQESHFVGEVMLESEADLAADDQLSGVADDGLDDSDDFEDDQGFQDDDGEAAGHLSYMKLVLDNPSYDWLLSSFKKEMLLTTSSLELFPGGESIRSKILNRLPTGVISTRESPRIYEVQYEVSWDLRAFLTRLGLEDSSGIDLDNTITLNGSGRSLQAIPCCQYVRQIWPSHGMKVLRLLQKSLAGEPGACFSDTLPDMTELKSEVVGSKLILTACGSSFAVAECGEQLTWLSATWLCAALQRGPCSWDGYCTPTITEVAAGEHKSAASPLSKRSVVYRIDFRFSTGDMAAQTGECGWRNLFAHPLVVTGFPIPRRPQPCPGVETSLEMLKRLIGGGEVTKIQGRIHMRGSHGALRLSKQTHDIFVWHFVPLEMVGTGGIYRSDQSVPSDDCTGPQTITLTNARHIIDDSPRAEQTSDSKADHALFGKKPSRFSAEASEMASQLAEITPIGFPIFSTTDGALPTYHGHDNSHDEARTTASNTVQYSACDNPCSGRSSTSDVGESFGSIGSVAPKDSQSNLTTISLDESIDTDMLSVSESSPCLDPFGLGPAASPLLTRMLHLLLAEWEGTRARPQSSGGKNSRPVTDTSQIIPSSSSPTTYSQPNRKRTRLSDEGDDDINEDDTPTPPSKKPTTRSDDSFRKLFACPFWKKNPTRHQACFTKRLARIRDVKQHLVRQHAPDFYCQRCLRVFKDKEQHRNHIMALERCPANPTGSLDGVSSEQRQALSKKSKRWETEAQQWYAIWVVLFDDAPRPETPYMDFEQSREFEDFVRFCQRRVGDILVEQMTTELLRSLVAVSPADRTPTLRRLVETGFRSAWESLSAGSTDSLETTGAGRTSSMAESATMAGPLSRHSLPSSRPTPSRLASNSSLGSLQGTVECSPGQSGSGMPAPALGLRTDDAMPIAVSLQQQQMASSPEDAAEAEILPGPWENQLDGTSMWQLGCGLNSGYDFDWDDLLGNYDVGRHE